jgi:transposase InsO family protein
MLGNGHVRFGRRAAETDQSKDRHRAAARPHTEHPTREGKVYCCVVLDVYSRRVVGWSIDAAQTATLVTNALGMALQNRGPTTGTVIHSDHGVQGGFNRSSQHRLVAATVAAR